MVFAVHLSHSSCVMNKKNKLVVKENFDEDDLSDDVDDEVFVRDGKKNSVKMEKHKGDEQPLMPVRRKTRQRQNTSAAEVCNRQPCNIYNCLLPVYFGIAAIISIACEYARCLENITEVLFTIFYHSATLNEGELRVLVMFTFYCCYKWTVDG